MGCMDRQRIAHSQELVAGVRVDDGVGRGVGCRGSDEGRESGCDHGDMRRERKTNGAMTRIVLYQESKACFPEGITAISTCDDSAEVVPARSAGRCRYSGYVAVLIHGNLQPAISSLQ